MILCVHRCMNLRIYVTVYLRIYLSIYVYIHIGWCSEGKPTREKWKRLELGIGQKGKDLTQLLPRYIPPLLLLSAPATSNVSTIATSPPTSYYLTITSRWIICQLEWQRFFPLSFFLLLSIQVHFKEQRDIQYRKRAQLNTDEVLPHPRYVKTLVYIDGKEGLHIDR